MASFYIYVIIGISSQTFTSYIIELNIEPFLAAFVAGKCHATKTKKEKLKIMLKSCERVNYLLEMNIVY